MYDQYVNCAVFHQVKEDSVLDIREVSQDRCELFSHELIVIATISKVQSIETTFKDRVEQCFIEISIINNELFKSIRCWSKDASALILSFLTTYVFMAGAIEKNMG